jgi:hypothetical protein
MFRDIVTGALPAGQRRDLLQLSLCGLLLTAVLTTFAGSERDPESFFPIAEGTAWVYQGVVRWKRFGYEATKEREVIWKMETGQVIRHGAFVAAVLKGFPADLNWTTGNPDPRDSLLVINGGNQYYFINPLHFRSAWIRVQAELVPLKGLMTETDLLFQLPLAQGQKFCGANVIDREENASMFCWHVGPELPIDLKGVKGIPAGKRPSYEIHYLTVVDETEVQIVPGIGITRYEYHRHTSPADTILNLTEFQPPMRKPR